MRFAPELRVDSQWVPCMLDGGLDPPQMDTSPLPSAKMGLMGMKWEQSPSLFSDRDTEFRFFFFYHVFPLQEPPTCEEPV